MNATVLIIEDELTPTPVQSSYQSMLKDKIEEVLGTLTPREARVLSMRFGLDTGIPYTLEEVGEKFGLTRERIRQIERGVKEKNWNYLQIALPERGPDV